MSFSRLLLRLALGRRLPITSGELRVRGVSAPVTVRRDKWGVPHIDAETDADAHFALGFCQGQDRAGQLEVMLRLGRGTLAEWVGADALPADRMSRHVGFRRAAEAQHKVLDAEARSAFEAFAAGLNAGAIQGLPQKPHEFAIVGGVPSAWDAADVLGMLKMMSFLLPSNWDVELARLRILLADGPDALTALDPVQEPLPQTPSPKKGGGVGVKAPPFLGEGLGRGRFSINSSQISARFKRSFRPVVGRTTGQFQARAPRPGSRFSRATHTSAQRARRRGIWRTSARRGGKSRARRWPARRVSPSDTTGSPRGASPRDSPTTRTSFSKRLAPTAALCARRMVRSSRAKC